jgi:hypothetical protein
MSRSTTVESELQAVRVMQFLSTITVDNSVDELAAAHFIQGKFP